MYIIIILDLEPYQYFFRSFLSLFLLSALIFMVVLC